MFGDYFYEKAAAQYTKHIIIIDDDGLNQKTDFLASFLAHGFTPVYYEDALSFRIEYEKELKYGDSKFVILANSKQYIPFDIQKNAQVYKATLTNLFPLLSPEVLAKKKKLDFELLAAVYWENFDELTRPEETEEYFKNKVYAKNNVENYLKETYEVLVGKIKSIRNYVDWFEIVEKKVELDSLAILNDIHFDTQLLNLSFQAYALKNFGKLSQEINSTTPVLVSKTMEYMAENSSKFIIIVMDGMSEFDWEIISNSFLRKEIAYEKTSMFAMIPSTTSISRQCLLAGKYPLQLMEPWRQSKEEQEFIAGAKKLGFTAREIAYERGYEAEFDLSIRCGAVIINDVDNLVHAQRLGRRGMYDDIARLSAEGKLASMTKKFISQGFDVYITADHGNTLCTGLGRLTGSGVEVETKSHKMVVLKEFAQKAALQEKYGLIEYPKYYLPKEYDYLICDVGESLDIKDEQVVTHGGISLDEVVIPFVKVKAVE